MVHIYTCRQFMNNKAILRNKKEGRGEEGKEGGGRQRGEKEEEGKEGRKKERREG